MRDNRVRICESENMRDESKNKNENVKREDATRTERGCAKSYKNENVKREDATRTERGCAKSYKKESERTAGEREDSTSCENRNEKEACILKNTQTQA
jgi:hypothetical protein